MPVVLSHQSACNYWIRNRDSLLAGGEVTHAKSLICRPPDLTALNHAFVRTLDRPLHILVSDRKHKRTNTRIIAHVWKQSLCKGSVVNVGEGLYVIAPELCLIQAAGAMPRLEFIKLAYEMCGCYSSGKKKEFFPHPLTSVSRLRHCIDRNTGIDGSTKAAKVLRYIADNSASPAETSLTMLLCLPFKWGGYGFDTPSLNQRVEKGKDKYGMTVGDYFVTDLMWPKNRVVIEYDSDEHHAGEERFVRDSIRRSELENLGYKVITVTQPELRTTFGMRKVANRLAKALNRRLRIPEESFSEKHDELRNVVLDFLPQEKD